jgi:putative SOS response-associated peptidase YedK
MCGRARLSSDVSEIKLVFSIPPERSTPNIPANWNAAPTEDLPVVRYDARAGERSLDVMRWGLVPFWAKDIKVGFATSTPKPRASIRSPPSARPFSGGAASFPSTAFTSGKRSAKTDSPTPSHSATGA